MKIANVLITGCSGGLGHAIALRLSKAGCHIYAVSRDEESLKKLGTLSSLIQPIVADIATQSGRQIITNLVNKNESLSIIHNAGIAVPGLFKSLKEADLRKHFETNYFAPALITHSLLPLLTKGQRILHISSGAANIALPGLMPYCASKAALQHMTHCLNSELNSAGIFCANLRPGMVDTPLQSAFRNTDERDLPNKEFYIHAEKEKKLINSEVVAEFVSWVMLKTEDIVFSQTSWNIYDDNHHDSWLSANWPKPKI